MEKGTIYFNSGKELDYNSVIEYRETGIFLFGDEGKIFVPYCSMEYVTEKNKKESKKKRKC